MKLSDRAQRFWLRLEQLFGPSLNAMYPRGMPAAMAQNIDRVNNDAVVNALAAINDLKQPPGIDDVERLTSSISVAPTKPNRLGLMVAYVVNNYRLTREQRAAPWTWVQSGGGIHAVVVPAIDDAPAIRVEMHELDNLSAQQVQDLLKPKKTEKRNESPAREAFMLLTGSPVYTGSKRDNWKAFGK